MSLSEEIFQDSYGFLWVGTTDGLIRFDGYDARYYSSDPNDSNSLSNNNLNAIYEDPYHRIWVGILQSGASYFNRATEKFYPVTFPADNGVVDPDLTVNDFMLDRQGRLWMGSNNGIYFTTPSVDTVGAINRYYGPEGDTTGLTHQGIFRIYIDRKDRIWVGSYDGINLIDDENGRIINYKTNSTFPSGFIYDIEEAPDGAIIVCPRRTFNKLYYFNEESGDFEPSPLLASFQRDAVRIAFDHKDNMWISSRAEGCYYLDTSSDELRFFDPNDAWLHGFRNVYPLTCMVDRYGNNWVIGSNVLKWPASNKAFNHVSSNDFVVVGVYSDEENIWFCGSVLARFNYSDNSIEEIMPEGYPTNLRGGLPNVLARNRIYRMLELDENRLVIASSRNIFIWDKRNDQFIEHATEWGGPFRDFILNPDKESVYICANQGSPVYLDLNTGENYQPPEMEEIVNPRAVQRDHRGNLWFGTSSDGVYRYEPTSHAITQFSPTSEDAKRELSSTYINDIHVDKSGSIWFGSTLGLNQYSYDSDSITQYRKQAGLPNDHITSIEEDDAGNLWLGTQQGLVKFSRTEQTFTNYNKTDGLINGAYSPRVSYKDQNGNLYFGGDLGVDYFNPAEIGKNTVPPDLYISQILVNKQPVATTQLPGELQSISLPHDEKYVEVELLALHLTAPKANRYAYRIPQISADWIDNGTQRTVALTNMRPGDYTLYAKASNADGVWSDEKILLELEIRKPYWATWWFISLIALLISGMILMAYRYRVEQIKKREGLKSEFNKRIAELESKALRAQMNPHFLFNSLNSVKSLISQGESDKATQYLTRFAQLIRQVLSNSEQQFVRLQEELKALRLYLEIEQLRFQNFEFDIRLADDINADFIEVPPLILQPYVENAIWHGLMHKTGGDRYVLVSVTRENSYLNMTVEDNGIGRERAGALKMRGSARKGGMGMRLTGDRLNLLRNFYGQEVTVDVTDLYDASKVPSGTRVTVRIPYSE